MNLYQLIEEYNNYIVIIAVSVSILSLIAVIINSIRTRNIIRRYKRLMRGMDNKNLEAMLLNQIGMIENATTRIENLEQRQKAIVRNLESCLQNVSLIRYNPFEQMGSDLSFSAALLDKKGDGIVLTGLFTRHSSSVYAKPIKSKTSSYPLSQEEMEAIEKAMS
ncbi:MAG: DUF4446 family protein [Clostridiales bacterium]|jgi:hypothetical protein|nr:DUF4446 family protein [Clostridiales bacterium]